MYGAGNEVHYERGRDALYILVENLKEFFRAVIPYLSKGLPVILLNFCFHVTANVC